MQGNVQSIDSLRELRTAVMQLADSFAELSFDLRSEVTRTVEWITVIAPEYWRQQLQLAERRLSEALDNLAAMQATYGGHDKPAATEAKKRVTTLRTRVSLCNQRLQDIKRWSAEIERSANLMTSTCANLQQQAEAELPKGAARLSGWIKSLDAYAESNRAINTNQPSNNSQTTREEN